MRCPPRPTARRGLSLLVVMVALSAAVVVSIAVLHTQEVAVRVAGQSAGILQAQQAAQTGLAAAIAQMQSPTWAGVETPVVGQVTSTAAGTATYTVSFSRVSSDGTPAGAVLAALHVHLTSVGSWLPAGQTRPVRRSLVATLRLTPRLPGRTVGPGDVATASDRAADLPGFTDAAAYAAFASDSKGKTFTPEPQMRIEGNLWVCNKDSLVLLGDIDWKEPLRSAWLDWMGSAIGQPYAPLAGTVTSYQTPDNSTRDDLTRLDVSYNTGPKLNLPAFDARQFAPDRPYRLLAYGFTYNSVAITTSTLSSTTLQPSDSNPLGIFYRDGDLTLGNGVTIRGSLVVRGKLTITGSGLDLAAVSGPSLASASILSNANLWPTLPAILAGDELRVEEAARGTVTGPVLAGDRIKFTAIPTYANETSLPLLTFDGPAITRDFDFSPPAYWKALSKEDWKERQQAWENANRPSLPVYLSLQYIWYFRDGLFNYYGWPPYYKASGLPYRPTLLIRRPPPDPIGNPVSYACQLPLFRPEPAATGGGYRWAVLSWREEAL